MPGEPGPNGLKELYAAIEDFCAEIGPVAAELSSGQLRSLVTDLLGKASAVQWYCARRLGGIPGRDDDGDAPPDTEAGKPGNGIDMAALYAMADHSATLDGQPN
jgi:hypothetical protein